MQITTQQNKNYIAGRGRQFVEIIKHVLEPVGVALTFVFHAVRQIVFVEQFLKITFNRLVERSEHARKVTRADEKNSVQKFFGLSGSHTFAVDDICQRVSIVFQNCCAVKRLVNVFKLRRTSFVLNAL